MLYVKESTKSFDDCVLMVIKTCKELNPNNDENFNCSGRCDEAMMIMKRLVEEYNKVNCTRYELNILHGEIAHKLSIPVDKWYYQHTWGFILNKNTDEKIYVDPTSNQFRFIFPDIPKVIISTHPLDEYYLANINNYVWKFKNMKINKLLLFWQQKIVYNVIKIIQSKIMHMK